jgi:hypothetical protein
VSWISISLLVGAKAGASCVSFLLRLARVAGHRDDSIYYDHRMGTSCADPRQHKACSGRWRGVISLGFAPDGSRLRRKVSESLSMVALVRKPD